MKVSVEDGLLRMIEAHPQNLATPEGICLKGLSYVERVYSPDRILTPLKKVRNGSFEPLSWPDTFNLLVEKLSHFKTTYGTQSILFYSGSGTKGLLNSVAMNFWRLFGGCTTTYGDLCWPAGLEATRLSLGENKHNAPWDIVNANLIILWGKNPAETNIHQMYYIEKAQKRGAKLAVIDPRRTQSSERADLLIQPRPGTDGALALAIAHCLVRDNRIDSAFIREHVYGFDAFSELVSTYTPDYVADICGISVHEVETLAADIGKQNAVTINSGYGMQRYTNSGQTIRAIIALLAITGNIGRPGSGWIFANLQSHIFDAVKDPIAFYPPQKPDGVVRVSISTTRLGRDIIKSADPPVKMIWVERGNPVTQNPATHNVLKAFRSLEFRVVIDQFMTDTAREADLILPAKTMFEQSDVIGAYWHPYIQYKQKIIDPPGDVKPESEIYHILARHLGFTVEEIQDKIPAAGDEHVEAFLRNHLTPFPELTLERLVDGPLFVPGYEEIAFADFKFSTPSGKIELVSKEAAQRWHTDILPKYDEPLESIRQSDGIYPLHFMTPNTKNRIHSQFNNLRLIRQFSEKPQVTLHPADARSRGIENGDLVRIFNDRGELTMPAKIDFGIRTGCISVSNGWWISEGGTVNFCSADRETDMGYGAAFHENLVQVEKAH
jgi:anaerobic selenocysteine-containing dehydrogenase